MDGYRTMSPKAMRRIAFLVGAFLLVLVVIAIIAFGNQKIYSATLNFVYTPTVATIMVDEKEVKSDTYRVKPGEHTIVAKMDRFETQEKKVVIEEGGEGTVYFILESNDPSTANWYLEHEDDERLKEGIMGKMYNDAMDEMLEKYPATEFLPYNTGIYQIGYGLCEGTENETCIVITTERASGMWTVALKRFTQLDEDLGRYDYEFVDYTNPFGTVGATELTSEEADVERAVKAMLTSANGSYTVKTIDSYDVYTTVVLSYVGNSNKASNDLYRLILTNGGGKWKVVAGPALVLSYDDYPDLPKEAIKKANEVF